MKNKTELTLPSYLSEEERENPIMVINRQASCWDVDHAKKLLYQHIKDEAKLTNQEELDRQNLFMDMIRLVEASALIRSKDIYKEFTFEHDRVLIPKLIESHVKTVLNLSSYLYQELFELNSIEHHKSGFDAQLKSLLNISHECKIILNLYISNMAVYLNSLSGLIHHHNPIRQFDVQDLITESVNDFMLDKKHRFSINPNVEKMSVWVDAVKLKCLIQNLMKFICYNLTFSVAVGINYQRKKDNLIIAFFLQPNEQISNLKDIFYDPSSDQPEVFMAKILIDELDAVLHGYKNEEAISLSISVSVE